MRILWHGDSYQTIVGSVPEVQPQDWSLCEPLDNLYPPLAIERLIDLEALCEIIVPQHPQEVTCHSVFHAIDINLNGIYRE